MKMEWAREKSLDGRKPVILIHDDGGRAAGLHLAAHADHLMAVLVLGK